jgi:hypothetical protein
LRAVAGWRVTGVQTTLVGPDFSTRVVGGIFFWLGAPITRRCSGDAGDRSVRVDGRRVNERDCGGRRL